MTLQLLSRADINMVGGAAVSVKGELAKKDWTPDPYFSSVVTKFSTGTTVLVDVVGFIRKNDYTSRLAEIDDLFDKAYRCVKQFVLASTMILDDTTSQKAYKIWEQFESHDINLSNLGYEQQLFLTDSLLKELEKPENKAIISELFGVADQLAVLKVHHKALGDIFQQSKEAEAAKANFVAPSKQSDVVRDILNKELLPYMEVMSKANPDLFAGSFGLITEFVNSVNAKVRARITRGENQNQEEILEENN